MSKILRVSQVLKLARAASFIESFYGYDNNSDDDDDDDDDNYDDKDDDGDVNDGIDTIGTFQGSLTSLRPFGCGLVNTAANFLARVQSYKANIICKTNLQRFHFTMPVTCFSQTVFYFEQ